MRKLTWKSLVALAVAGAGLAAGSLAAGEPEDAGIVRLPNEPVPGGQKVFSIQPPIRTAAQPNVPESGLVQGCGVGGCDAGCDTGCSDGCHGGCCLGCLGGCCGGCGGLLQRLHCHSNGNYATPIEAWLLDRNAVTYPPDYGWSRPIKRPILNRVPVQYYKMDPDFWYGDPRAFAGIQTFPMIYQPTDTTQLGYTYARVPTWQPNPNMLPAPPWPSTWHARECPNYTRAHLVGNVGGYAGGVPVEGYEGGTELAPAPVPADLPKGEKAAPAKDAKKLTPGDLKRSAQTFDSPRY